MNTYTRTQMVENQLSDMDAYKWIEDDETLLCDTEYAMKLDGRNVYRLMKS